MIAQAGALHERNGSENVSFSTGDVCTLEFDDASFDVVHAHQVLQHLQRPVAALAELRRVLRPAGVLAVRDSDYAAFVWAPDDPLLDRWNALYHELSTHNGAEADAGRYLLGWVQQAGFRDVRATSSTWTFADPERRAWWGSLWADRVEQSAYAEQAIAYGLSGAAELAAIAGAWRRWVLQPDGYFAVLHGRCLPDPDHLCSCCAGDPRRTAGRTPLRALTSSSSSFRSGGPLSGGNRGSGQCEAPAARGRRDHAGRE